MAKKNFKSIKSYKNLNKSDRAYIDGLINRGYSVDFLNVIFNLASEHHPLDLMTYIAKYSKANEASDIFIKMYSPYFDIVLGTEKVRISKTEISYLFGWIMRIRGKSFFNSRELNQKDGERLVSNLGVFSDELSRTLLISSGLLNELKEAMLTNDKLKMRGVLSKFYLSLYHQFGTGVHDYNRLRYIIEGNSGKAIFEDLNLIKKQSYIYLILLFGIYRYGGGLIIRLEDIIQMCRIEMKLNINETDFLEFIEFYGVCKYDELESDMIKESLNSYFPIDGKHNLCNLPSSINRLIFDISSKIGKKSGYYIMDTSVSSSNLLGIITKENLLKKGLIESKFYENYCSLLMQDWLLTHGVLLDFNHYQFGSGTLIRAGGTQGDIDFYIFNKNTGQLVIFEIKHRKRLGKDIYLVDTLEHLTSKASNIPGRKKGKDGDIYHGISQLDKFYQLDKQILASQLHLDSAITDVIGIFLNTTDVFAWNAIMKPMLDGNFSIPDDKYHFMSLEEFEIILSTCFKRGIDFFQLINQKNTENSLKNEYLDIIFSKLRSSNNIDSKLVYSNTTSKYESFETFLYANYNAGDGGGFFPVRENDVYLDYKSFFGEIL